jgi:cell division protein FtsA
MGASTTNMAIIEDGEVQHVAVIPMGGINITNDLAIGLKTELDIAEMVKIQHAALAGEIKPGRLSVTYENRNHAFDSEEIAMIVEARVEEILDYVEKELKRIHKSRKLPGGVMIVGGTANLPGIAKFTKDQLQLSARIGKIEQPSGIIDDIKKPEYITAIGLMQLDMLFAEQMIDTPSARRDVGNSILNNVSNLLKRFK